MNRWRKLALASTAALILSGAASEPALAQKKPPAAAAKAVKWPGLPAGATEEYMTLRDGVRLAANVYKPVGQGPWPVVLARTPYIKDGVVTAQNPKPGENMAKQARRYTDAGYVYVVQDVRGKGRSQGFYQAFENDIEDGYDAVEWAAAQPWSNGKVGMTGGSALGITANSAALAAPPHLKAAYVIVAPADRLSYSYPGGVLKEKDTIGWLTQQGVPQETLDKTRGRSLDDVSWNRVAMTTNRKYIQIPIFNVGGWYDIFNGGTVDNFEYLQNQGAPGARGNQKLLMGPFGHGQLSGDLAYPGSDRLGIAGDQEIRWFDYWLKGQENGIMDEPPVQYFMMAGAKKDAFSPKNRMMTSPNWPPAYREVRYYPTADKGLATKAPTTAETKLSYRFDPADPVKTFGGANLTFERGPEDQRQVGQRQDYLRFQTPVLDKDVAIAGPVKVELYAATDGPDTDFVAKLVDVYPDGYEALVLDAPIRTKFRNGRLPEDIRMMTPGAPEKLVIDLWPTAITFEKGHRIALHITSSNSPRFEVNPNTGEPPALGKLKPRVATNSIYLDEAHPTALVLPVIYPTDIK
ncbi:CocE/NonD family hydrolase [Phenylobacterium sp.]|uniref:CocE/NonD family hydrolase n=1 Tax=Phenylobacterium sp. TaxID=1871053 RepID=UPI0025EDC90F|nr:CocE/NonD family hydrolase [Phenylobacterium sp.]